jgi:hypothetical protein
MKFLVKVFLVIGLAGASVGCQFGANNDYNLTPAPTPENPIPPPGGGGEIQEQDLTGKTLSEILSVKYTRAVLVCKLWSMLSNQLDLTRNPNSSSRFNLKAPYRLPFTIVLKSGVNGVDQDQYREIHQTEVRITVYNINLLQQMTLSHDQSNLIYQFQYSPAPNFAIDAIARTQRPGGGQSVDRYSNPEDTLYEKVNWPVLQFESYAIPNNYNLKTYDYASCELETTIRPEYAHQFSVTRRDP